MLDAETAVPTWEHAIRNHCLTLLFAACACMSSLGIACGSSVDHGSAGTGQAGAQADASGVAAGSGASGSVGAAGVAGSAGSVGTGMHDDAGSELDASSADGSAATDAADGGASDAGAGGGNTSYDPCPAAGTPCTIMPLGDSITYGQGSSDGGGYRSALFHLAHADHKSFSFVGAIQSGPASVDGAPFPTNNEGYPGYVIGDENSLFVAIAPLVSQELTTYKPNIVTLMIGTNDMSQMLDLPNAPTRLGKLIDKILASAPKLLLIVAQITPTQDDAENTRVMAYNAAIPALVQTRAAAGKHVLLVDMYSAFTTHADYKTADLADAVHPNAAGYAIMADVWYSKLATLLH